MTHLSGSNFRVEAERHQFHFDANSNPVLSVPAGSVICIETLDCFCNRLTPDSPPLDDDEAILAHIGGAYNPICGAIFVEDAEPGDVLEVDILDIGLGRSSGYAVTHVATDWARQFDGDRFANATAPSVAFASFKDDLLQLPIAGATVAVPARPMIGTIGTAPEAGKISSMLYGPGHGGNMDCPRITTGSTLLLPVNVPGALFSLGDVHALMGDGEITGTAFETSAEVTVRLRLHKNGPQTRTTPRLVDELGFGSLGCVSRMSLQDNIRAATQDLISWVAQISGLSLQESLLLVNMYLRIHVNQSVGTGTTRWLSALSWLSREDIDHAMAGQGLTLPRAAA